MRDYELEQGSKKFRCPNCGAAKKFVREVHRVTGEYAPADFGRCERVGSCGYSKYMPSQTAEKKRGARRQASPVKKPPEAISRANAAPKKTDYIGFEIFKKTLTGYDRNAFAQFLLNLFPDDPDLVAETIKKYFVGTSRAGKTIYWQIDDRGKIRTGKLMLYDPASGKRRKDVFPGWVHAELMKRQGKQPGDFNLSQCFFGEHLLTKNPDSPVAVVEAEKTALIASICLPGFVWLAVGGVQNLNAEKLEKLRARKIILYPDGDFFEKWREIACAARKNGLTVNVSDLIEKQAADAEKRAGYDLADYLIDEQKQINQFNQFADDYNAALDKVLNDEFLFERFNRKLAARKVSGLDQIRETVLQIA